MTIFRLAPVFSRIVGRQKAVWIAIAVLTAMALASVIAFPRIGITGTNSDIALVGQCISMVCGFVYVPACNDFFISSRLKGLREVEASTHTSQLAIHLARLIGTLSIFVAPTFAILIVWGIYQMLRGHPLGIVTAIGVTILVAIPICLFAVAYSALVGTILPRGISRILGTVIWILIVGGTGDAGIFPLNRTLFSFNGDPVLMGIFRAQIRSTLQYPLGLSPNWETATISLIWQLAVITCCFILGSFIAKKRQKVS